MIKMMSVEKDHYDHKIMIRKAKVICAGKSDQFIEGVAMMLSIAIYENTDSYLYLKKKLE